MEGKGRVEIKILLADTGAGQIAALCSRKLGRGAQPISDLNGIYHWLCLLNSENYVSADSQREA